MPRTGLLAFALLLLPLVDARAESLTLYSAAGGDSFLASGDPEGIGDRIVWHDAILPAPGAAPAGTGSGACTRLDAAGAHLCTIVLALDGRGIITLGGIQQPEPAPSTLVVTGGQGEFAGRTGWLLSTPVLDRAFFRYELTLD